MMRQKGYMIGIVALGLMATSLQVGPSYCNMLRSARDFHQYFQSFGSKADLNPLERLVFSLMLAGAHSDEGGAVSSRTS